MKDSGRDIKVEIQIGTIVQVSSKVSGRVNDIDIESKVKQSFEELISEWMKISCLPSYNFTVTAKLVE